MNILGIDPGLHVTGYGVIDSRKRSFILKEAGILKTSAKEKIENRLEKIHQNLVQIIEEHKPEVVILEKLYSHYKHPVTAILMGHVRGVICLTAGSCGIPVISYPAKRVRQALTGNGNASKLQVQRVISDMLSLKTMIKYNDVSDALALALGYVHMERR
jgi:crossover junction endodeoxyribonuclease RuvC